MFKKLKKIEKIKRLEQDITSLRGMKILLTEDKEINQMILLGLLEKSGIKVDIANNGKEAVAKYHQQHYKLILMDIEMPIMDGYEATTLIREQDKDIPIIALSANGTKEDMKKTKGVGVNEYLHKPIEVEKLYETFLKYMDAN